MSKLFFVLIVASAGHLSSCSQGKADLPRFHNWKGGVIREPGIYFHEDKNLQLKVYIDNKLLKNEMVDSKGNQLLSNGKVTASVLHNWAFYLDDDKNLWCLSSDLGHSEWKFDSVQNKYSLIKFGHNLEREAVPTALYRDLRIFFD